MAHMLQPVAAGGLEAIVPSWLGQPLLHWPPCEWLLQHALQLHHESDLLLPSATGFLSHKAFAAMMLLQPLTVGQ